PHPTTPYSLSLHDALPICNTGGGITNNLYIFDINTNTWTTGPPSPLASDFPAGTAIGGKFYMLGGGAAGSPGYTQYTYLYDPVTDRKSTRLNSSHDQISYA